MIHQMVIILLKALFTLNHLAISFLQCCCISGNTKFTSILLLSDHSTLLITFIWTFLKILFLPDNSSLQLEKLFSTLNNIFISTLKSLFYWFAMQADLELKKNFKKQSHFLKFWSVFKHISIAPSPQRGEKVTHGKYSEKVFALCSIQRRQSLRSPASQSWDRNFQIFFLHQLPNLWFVISHVGCTAHSIHTTFLPPLYPLSIAFLFIFWSSFSPASLSSFCFPLIPSHPSEYSVYLGFFLFYNHWVLPSLSLPTSGTLPGQPGTGALGDPSIFQRQEVTAFWWLLCGPSLSVSLQTWADMSAWIGFPFSQQATFPLHW